MIICGSLFDNDNKKHCHIQWLLKRLPPFNGIQKQYLHGPEW
jgi:hypothetical protein